MIGTTGLRSCLCRVFWRIAEDPVDLAAILNGLEEVVGAEDRTDSSSLCVIVEIYIDNKVFG